jgi:hypothetical protein
MWRLILTSRFLDGAMADGACRAWHHPVMADDDERVTKPELPRSELIEMEEVKLPALAKPATLVQGLRFLQRRVPHFTQLSLDEERSMANAAHLEPEFLDAGIHAAGAWPESEGLIRLSAEEMRSRLDATASWADVRRELHALDKGIAGAILGEKHQIGTAILKLYRVIGTLVKSPQYQHLRPYYEDMKRTYGRRPRARKAPKQAAGKPDQPEE